MNLSGGFQKQRQLYFRDIRENREESMEKVITVVNCIEFRLNAEERKKSLESITIPRHVVVS